MKKLSDAFLKREELAMGLAELSDVSAILEAENRCFPNDPWTEGIFLDSLKNPVCSIYAVYNMQTTKIVAYCIVSNVCDEGEILNIAVIPEERRNGIGRSLLWSIIEECDRKGTEKLFLEVRRSNVAARELYVSCGFKKIGERRNYYSSPKEDADILCREK